MPMTRPAIVPGCLIASTGDEVSVGVGVANDEVIAEEDVVGDDVGVNEEEVGVA